MNYELEGKELATLVKEWQSSLDLLVELLGIPVCTILQKKINNLEVIATSRANKVCQLALGETLAYASLPEKECQPIAPYQPYDSCQYLPLPDSFKSCRFTAIHHSNGSIFGYLCLFDTQPLTLNKINQKVINQIKTFIEKILTISENNKKFKYLSERDYLTALFNRRAFFKYAQAEQERCLRLKQEMALLYLDLDHFKEFNDIFGHESGDKLLIDVAECLTMKMRRYDVFARFGGEEFVVLLSNIDLTGATKKAESLRKSIAKMQLSFCPQGAKITASIGVTALNGGESIEQAICRADGGLYAAKQNGRNLVEVIKRSGTKSYIQEP